jgi:hypothetical protein
MKEGTYWREKLRPALLREPALKNWILWKHCDMYTRAIPDFSLSFEKTTIWFELKIWPNGPTKMQAYYIKRLRRGGTLITVDKDLKRAWMQTGAYCDVACDLKTSAAVVEWLVSEIVRRCVNV